MAAKYQLITELYRRTGVSVAKSPQAWQSFLSSACHNYKCRFDEQLLIYAQRPDAVAVAELGTWNKLFKRWVNKDSKGIAVFDPKGRRNTLKYYFDISDTHEGYYGSRPVPIWQMDERYEQAVKERLSDRFGELEETDLAETLFKTAENAVEDNLPDYLSQLKGVTQDSFLEELDEYNIEVLYKRLAVNSVASLVQDGLGYLDFDSLVSVTEEQLEPFYKEEAPAPAEIQDNQELIGKEVVIDNRRYVIERISEISGDVSMRDVTFQNQAGIPINRVEKIGYIRSLLEREVLPPEKENVDVPVPSDDRRNFRITDDALGVGGAKEKFRNNIAAIQTLHELEIENRLATPEEQEILSKYVGWGGLSQAFDENNAAWADEFVELYENLSPEEYRAAMESTLTAFYTPPVVIKAMYEVLDRLGYEKGNILEPSCGTGNFFGLLPEKMAGSKLYGVELDDLTGRIANKTISKS